VSFIKDLDLGEVWHNYTKSYVEVALGDSHKNEFTTWSSSYLDRQTNNEDVDPSDQHRAQTVARNYFKGLVKYYC
jgi:hypothetical protein